MKMIRWMPGILALVLAAAVQAQEPTALSCSDFRPTPAALERYPQLEGACEAVVERGGELYVLYRAVVRRSSSRRVVLYIPAVDRTVEVEPKPGARAIIDGRKVRPRQLERGQELRIYLAVSEFAEPVIDEIAFTTEEDLIIEHYVALPSTASRWPAVGLLGVLLVGAAIVLRRVRLA